MEHAAAVATVLRLAFAEYAPQYTAAAYAATALDADGVLRRIREGPTWIAVRGGQIVGTASALDRDAGLYIRGMAVNPAASGAGIGRLLLEQIERFAEAEGAARLFLSTTPFLKRAIALYERFGFRISNEGPFELSGTPLFTMQKPLVNEAPHAVMPSADHPAAPEGAPALPEGLLVRRATKPVAGVAHPSDLTIRDAVPADTEALVELYRPFVMDTAVSFEVEPPSDAEFSQRVAAAQSKWAWLIAESGGTLVGYAYGSSYRARTAYRWSVETSAYVDPRHHGRGIGKALYGQLLARLADKGYCTAFAGITLPNSASVGLHRSLGFDEVGVFRRAGHKFGRWHDVSWWQRELRDSPP